jgi:hypothetical protein
LNSFNDWSNWSSSGSGFNLNVLLLIWFLLVLVVLFVVLLVVLFVVSMLSFFSISLLSVLNHVSNMGLNHFLKFTISVSLGTFL